MRQPLDVQLDKACMSLSQAQQLLNKYLDTQTTKNQERRLKVPQSLQIIELPVYCIPVCDIDNV